MTGDVILGAAKPEVYLSRVRVFVVVPFVASAIVIDAVLTELMDRRCLHYSDGRVDREGKAGEKLIMLNIRLGQKRVLKRGRGKKGPKPTGREAARWLVIFMMLFLLVLNKAFITCVL